MKEKFFYVSSSSLNNLIVYFSMCIGPINNMIGDTSNGKGVSFYFDPFHRNEISIFPCLEKDKEEAIMVIAEAKDTKNEKEIDSLTKRENYFLVVGIGTEAMDINERIREVCSMSGGGVEVDVENVWEKGTKKRTVTYIPHTPITVGAYNVQLEKLRLCINSGMKHEWCEKIANEKEPKKRAVNLAYGLMMYSGWTNKRKFTLCRDKREDKILPSLCDKIDALFFQRTPNPYTRIQCQGMRLNTMDLVVWAYLNYGMTNLKEILDNYNDLTSAYKTELKNLGYNAALKETKETLEALVS